MTNRKVSVLIATYNHDCFLKRSIDSVLNQTYKNLEVIVIDDCSTDNTKSILSKYEDPRLKVYKNDKNIGFIETRNKLLELATGNLIAFQDSDDIWMPEKIEKQVKYINSHPNCGAIFTKAIIIDENNNAYTKNSNCDIPIDTYQKYFNSTEEIINEFFYNGNFLSHSSALIKKSVIDKVGSFNVRLLQLQDFDYWCRIINKYDLHVLNENLMYVRRISGGHIGLSASSKTNAIRCIHENAEIIFNLISNLNKKKFLASFDPIKKHIDNEIILECEKYFLLLNWHCGGLNNKLPALLYFNQCCNEEFLHSLSNFYGYNLSDYYNESSQALNMYPRMFDEEFINIANKNEILKKELKDIYNSKSWLITKPLRKLSSFINNK